MRRFLKVVLLLWAAAVAWWLRGRDRAGLEYAGPADADPAAVGGAPGDAVVKARVESELFRDDDVPKGDVVIDVVGGVVTVRGSVPPRLVDDLPVRIAAVDGVLRVDSRLHAPDAPPAA
jgi:osmotically-inducible protein OsmY